jgi:hypothetical protein
MAMMKLRSLRDRSFTLQLEGKRYEWPKMGSVMKVPDKIGAWLVGKANDRDRNPELTEDRKRLDKPGLLWLEIVEADRGEQQETVTTVVAEMPKEPPAAPAKTPAAPAAPAAK